MTLKFSQACENNKQPILAVIKPYLQKVHTVLEVGSGSGQHAVYFAENLPHLQWQPSDLAENLCAIRQRVDQSGLANILPALELDVDQGWPVTACEAIFAANVLHIISWEQAQRLFAGVAEHLRPGGLLFLYGPFNYQGQYTSDSNRRFDLSLKQHDPLSGIRDFEAVAELAEKAELRLLLDQPMPANNRCLVWRNMHYDCPLNEKSK